MLGANLAARPKFMPLWSLVAGFRFNPLGGLNRKLYPSII